MSYVNGGSRQIARLLTSIDDSRRGGQLAEWTPRRSVGGWLLSRQWSRDSMSDKADETNEFLFVNLNGSSWNCGNIFE